MFSILISLATIVLGTVFIIIALSWMIARLWCRPMLAGSKKTPKDYSMGFENVKFSVKGVLLRGWFIPASSAAEKNPAIIVQHGWSKNAAAMLPVAKALHTLNTSLLLFDFRGHGRSDKNGPVTLQTMAQDISAAIDYLETRSDVNPNNIGVMGHSIGGAGTILAGSRDSRIKAIASSAAFADPVAVTLNYMKKFYIPEWPFLWLMFQFIGHWVGHRIDFLFPKNNIGKIQAPITLLHGGEDNFIPSENLDILYSNSKKDRTEVHLIPGCKHSNIIEHPHHALLITEFFKNHMSLTVKRQNIMV
ncbi:MAG: alpha/beta fold hydrolase [Deltaproteobacteria bacterium]|uniref:alpha/beta hydrolase n=1 Tax=Desulfobacula sp. TaxID=2593537 RepID=UPI0019BBDD32|nr:alpha/beta fold hydrolase [Candidatus Desulfobacula maris]MBL6994988.1 alpha/beta fold hydrolase [Desulfobacula sp.]